MRSGLLAEFDSPATCAKAIRSLKQGGVRKLDVFMPYPDKQIQQALDVSASFLPRIVFMAGALGAILAYAILWFTNVYDYPLNVGGRPSHAVPAFIPITFETTILFAGGAAFLGAVLLGGMPRLYQPIDEAAGFELASVDRFLLAVDGTDASFDCDGLSSELRNLGALSVQEFGTPNGTPATVTPKAELEGSR